MQILRTFGRRPARAYQRRDATGKNEGTPNMHTQDSSDKVRPSGATQRLATKSVYGWLGGRIAVIAVGTRHRSQYISVWFICRPITQTRKWNISRSSTP